MDGLAFWRDLSIIWLSLFCFVGLLPPLVIGYFLMRGMRWVLRKSDWLFDKAQGYTHQGRTIVDDASQRAVAPVIAAQKQATKFETVLRRLWPFGHTADVQTGGVITTGAHRRRNAHQSSTGGVAVVTTASQTRQQQKGAKVYG